MSRGTRWSEANLIAYNARQAVRGKLPCERLATCETPPGKERELHEAIREECARRGWIPLHGSMAHRAHRTVGEPDFVIIAGKGRTFLIEAKTKAGKLRPEQRAMIAWARKLGHTAAVVRSLEEFLEVVQESGGAE